MIQVIAGKKGSGKTKRLIDMTNKTAKEASHLVVFLDDDNRYMFDVDHSARFVNAQDYHIHNADMFLGFLSGMLSCNFDIGTVFIDAFLKISKAGADDMPELVEGMDALSGKHNVNFVLSVSSALEDLPACLRTRVI